MFLELHEFYCEVWKHVRERFMDQGSLNGFRLEMEQNRENGSGFGFWMKILEPFK